MLWFWAGIDECFTTLDILRCHALNGSPLMIVSVVPRLSPSLTLLLRCPRLSPIATLPAPGPAHASPHLDAARREVAGIDL